MGITRRQNTWITLFASRGCQRPWTNGVPCVAKQTGIQNRMDSFWIYIVLTIYSPVLFLILRYSEPFLPSDWLKPLSCHGGPSRTRHTVSCVTPVSRLSWPGVRSLSPGRWWWIRRRNGASKSGDAKKLQSLGSQTLRSLRHRRLKIQRILLKTFSWEMKCLFKVPVPSTVQKNRKTTRSKFPKSPHVFLHHEVMDSKAMLPGLLPRCKAGVSPWKTPMWRSHRYAMQSQCHTCHTLRLSMIESFFTETHWNTAKMKDEGLNASFNGFNGMEWIFDVVCSE